MFRIVCALVVLLSANAALAGEWLAFRDPAGAFTVDLPGTPSVSSEPKAGANGQMIPTMQYLVDRGTLAFILMTSDFGGYELDAGKAIDGAVDGVKGAGIKTLSDTIDKLDGQVGREVVVLDKDGFKIDNRLFVVNKKLYQIMYVLDVKATAADMTDAKHFQSSFHFAARTE